MFDVLDRSSDLLRFVRVRAKGALSFGAISVLESRQKEVQSLVQGSSVIVS